MPDAKPTVFTHEAMSSINNESVLAFTPDAKTAYIADETTIVYSTMINGKWSKTFIAPFSGHWKDWDPALKPDGRRLIFVSNRPLENMPQDTPQKDNHLWYVNRLADGKWSTPKHFEAPVNIAGSSDYGPSVSSTGSICFCSRNRDGNKGMRGYYAKCNDDQYTKPELLSLNGEKEIFDPFIAPDESYIIFVSEGDLYISYRHSNKWAQGEKLAAVVNNGKSNSDPYVSPDRSTLYYNQDKTPGILMVPVRFFMMRN
jgi:Tol biopolymer transport system component